MRRCMRLFIATTVVAVAPAFALGAQERSVDAKSIDRSGRNATSAAKKGVTKQVGGGTSGTITSRPVDLSPAKEPTDFNWSGVYGGINAGGAFGSTDRSEP